MEVGGQVTGSPVVEAVGPVVEVGGQVTGSPVVEVGSPGVEEGEKPDVVKMQTKIQEQY